MVDVRLLDSHSLARSLSLRDLTDPAGGPHAIQAIVTAISAALESLEPIGAIAPRIRRGDRIVSVADNYDRLRFSAETVTRDARYTRYVTADAVLRTHTSALVPSCLRELAREPGTTSADVQLVIPGIVYRRDSIDRLHCGEPHQLDLWRIRREGPRLDSPDLERMIGAVVDAALPGRTWRTSRAEHPYTQAGLQIDIDEGGTWIEIGECGLAHPEVLAGSGLSSPASGLAMGLGLDRLVMLRKGIPDIRLLRATDPRIARQMLDLDPYREVSSMPPVRRDLSIAIAASTTAEELGDRVRSALGERSESIEEIAVVSETAFASLPAAARERLGIGAEQKNVLLRIVLRDVARTLTHSEANELRNAIYAAVHEGSVHAWAT